MLRFEDIPLDLTDLRLMVRQTADVLRRFGALEDADYQQVQALGRDMKLLDRGREHGIAAADRQQRVAAVRRTSPADRAGDRRA